VFRPLSHNAQGDRSITPDGVYNVLRRYASIVGIDIEGFGPHALRATAATNSLEHDVDIAKVQQWLGHANISTTRVYDRRQMRAEDSPTFRVAYLKIVAASSHETAYSGPSCEAPSNVILLDIDVDGFGPHALRTTAAANPRRQVVTPYGDRAFPSRSARRRRTGETQSNC